MACSFPLLCLARGVCLGQDYFISFHFIFLASPRVLRDLSSPDQGLNLHPRQ